MGNKVCLITGATSGLGKSISIKLSKQDYNLILISKSKAKLNSLSKILGKSNIQYVPVDLSNFKEIKKFTKKIYNVDILINNAGNFFFEKEKNNKSINKTIMINYFTPLYLIKKLILKNKFIKKKLIINISSHTIMKSNIPISKMHDLTNYNGWEIYKFSKLLSFLITNFLSKKYKNVKFISFDPGRMKTNFGAGNNFFLRYLTKLYLKILGKNPNIPAEKIVELIDAHKKNIKVKKNKKIINFNKMNANVNNLNLQKKLWAETNKVFEINEKN